MKYELVLVERVKETYNSFPSNLYSSLYPILIGLLFALPKFVRLIKVEGRLSYDWIRIVAVGIPTLFGATVFLIYFSPLGAYFPSISILSVGTKFSTICGIVFGYLILSCFQKSNIDP
ncbi:hypothetical protein J31TS6_47860 [Brevibacillus reuszeri]|nr:hypothetical protein J31TS6_47860 [Brevibacillus reuszeri]